MQLFMRLSAKKQKKKGKKKQGGEGLVKAIT